MLKNFIRKNSILLSVLLLSVVINGCRNLEFESHWSEQSLSIDGRSTDWEAVPLHRLEALQASMGLSNDDEDVYLLVTMANPMMAQRVLSRGISLSFAEVNVKKPYLTLQYTGSDTALAAASPTDSFWEILTPDQKKRFLKQQIKEKNRIRIVQNGKTILIPPDGTQGPAAAVILQGGSLGYEFKIPVQSKVNGSYAVKSQPGEHIEIGIELGPPVGEERQMKDFVGRNPSMERKVRFTAILACR